MADPERQFYEFGQFRLDAARGLLFKRDGEPVPLTRKGFEMLLLLVSNSGRVVEKDEFIRTIWPDTFVEEGILTVHVSHLRKALGDDRNGNKFIETVPRRGYRFVAEVREVRDEQPAPAAETSSVSGAVTTAEEEEARPRPEIEGEPQAVSAPQVLAAGAGKSSGGGRSRSFTVATVCLALAGLIVAMAFVWKPARSEKDEPLAGFKSIAVLPFEHLDGGGGDQALELGMTDALITKLSSARKINVRPTKAILKYAEQPSDPLAAGRELGVDALLFGSVQKTNDRIRVTVQLVRVRDGAPLWAETFDERFGNIFTVQDVISAQVARALTLELTGEEQKQLRKRYAQNTEAYQAYLKGRYFLTGPGNNLRTKEGIEKAGEYFRQAIAIDPAYALAYVGLADYYVNTNYYGAPPSKEAAQENLQKARALTMKALEMDEELAEAHATLGFILTLSSPDWSGVEKEYKRAIELNPNYAVVYYYYAGHLSGEERFDEALAMLRRAQELDPLSPMIARSVGGPYWQQRRFAEAAREYRKALELEPSFWPAHESLAMALSHMGKHDEAIAAALKAREITKGNLESTYILGRTYGLAGRKEETLKIIDEINERSQRENISPMTFAGLYQALGGEEERVLDLLEKSYEEAWLTMISLKYDPLFDGVRSHPRFQAMMQRVDPFPAVGEIQGG